MDYKISYKEKGKTLLKVNERQLTSRILFSFSFFNGESIKIKNFNNYYANEYDAQKSINDLFKTLKEISKLNIKELLSNNYKKQFHYNEFNDNLIIDRIERVLIDGYKMPENKVNEFERLYFELSFSNGIRLIGTKIDNNIFEILFIDSNHMICKESSRMLNIKEKYEYPSIFNNIEKNINIKEYEHIELLEMLIDSAKKGGYNKIEDFINDYEELLEYNKNSV